MINLPLGNGYAIREWQLTDVKSLVKYANNRKISVNLRDTFPNPYTLADARDFIGQQQGRQIGINLAIDHAGEAIGGVGLQPQTDVHRFSAEIGYWLGEPFWGKGIATNAVRAMCQHGFSEMHLVRIYAAVFAWNPASMRVLEKAGFIREGIFRKSVVKDGKVVDSVLFALIDLKATAIDSTQEQVLRARSTLHHKAVWRRGDLVVRESGPWTPTVHSLLRHLESVGFPASRVAGSGFDGQKRETLIWIEGGFMQTGPWSLEGAAAVGTLLRRLHDATASFAPPVNAIWGPWFGRTLGSNKRVIGHCDMGPWNIVAREGLPVALIDWDFSGPVDPMVELAQACWLNAKLYSDDVAATEGLPPLADRARQLRAMVDAYGLTAAQRRGFLQQVIDFVVYDTAEQADDAGVTSETKDPAALWALTWRARSGAWILRSRRALESALA